LRCAVDDDLVVYPTGWEGFGNQLIEAFAAGLPSIVFEYPVYREDIGPKGFEIVSLEWILRAGAASRFTSRSGS
jgi:glycosyltransferase involved in cell wall biosynthesis